MMSNSQRAGGAGALAVLVLALLACATAGIVFYYTRPKPTVQGPTIVVSGDTAGWITPCGCASNQSGGLLRRGTYLADLRQKGEVIYLDAGGAAGGDSEYHRVKFEAILEGEKGMGVAAHNLGKAEIALGVDYLRKLSQKSGVHLV